MRKLSFCIPTYNRALFLKRNLEIIISQIIENQQENDISIHISDNASTDSTKEVVEDLIQRNPSISLNYKKNKENIGPDENYINAMFMADSEYAIIWSDDDYLKETGLSTILDILDKSKEEDISLFLSNKTDVDANGRFIKESYFLRKDAPNRTFDFSNEDSAHAFFSYVNQLGGIMTFISSVIWNTSILSSIGEYNHKYTGTYFSFFYYFWGCLKMGGKLKFNNLSYINSTTVGHINENFGVGLHRTLVDFEGVIYYANEELDSVSYKYDFMLAPLCDHSICSLQRMRLQNRRLFDSRILPCLKEMGFSDNQIHEVLISTSCKFAIYILLSNFLPSRILAFFNSKAKKIRKGMLYIDFL